MTADDWCLCGQTLCVIVKSKDDVQAFENYQPSDAAPAAAPPAPPAPAAPTPQPVTAAVAGAAAVPADGRVLASPFAKKIAAEKGIDLRVCLVILFVDKQFSQQQKLHITNYEDKINCD